MEEMEKRSDRHIRDLVAHTAFKGLDANEIGCARISVMAGSNCSLQRAEYRCARPIISKLSYPTCNARPVHTDVPTTYIRWFAIRVLQRQAIQIGHVLLLPSQG